MEDVKFIKEADGYIAENASSWFAQAGFIGTEKNCSITFVNFISKIQMDEYGMMSGSSSLVTEAIATLTLSEANARSLAEAIISQLDSTVLPKQ